MVQVRPKDLPAGTPTDDSALIFDNGASVQKVTPAGLVDVGAPLATQAQAEAGIDNTTRMSPLRTAQAVVGKAQAAALGVPGDDNNMGTYTGSTIPDNETAKQNIQALGTSVDGRGFTLIDKGGVGDASTDNATAITAALAATSDRVVKLSRATGQLGDYLSSTSFYGYVNCRFEGDGRLVLGGKGQARDRAFITNEVTDPDYSALENYFDGDWSKQAETNFTFVGSSVGSTAISAYRLMDRASQKTSMFVNAGGVNTALGNQAGGRTGMFRENVRMIQGGQGDLMSRFTYLQAYSTKPGATHFLACPAVSLDGADFEGLADGNYLQFYEVNFHDSGAAVAVGNVVNYTRTNAGSSLHQTWKHDNVQSVGTQPIDGLYQFNGAANWVHDVTNATLTNGCWAALPQDTFIYFKASPTFDPAGVNKGPTLSQYRMGYSSVANAFVVTINNIPVLQIGENQIIVTRPIVVPSVTVSALPAAAPANRGMEYYVTDANSTTRLATAVGGGSNYVKVFSNGTNWLIQ